MSWRLIRHIGDPNPWDDPNLGRAMQSGSLPITIAERLAFYDKWQKQTIMPGKSSRLLGPESGFSMSYMFGPTQYLVWMLDSDWDILRGNRWERWQFIDVTSFADSPSMLELAERPKMSRDHWMMLLDDFAKIGPGRKVGGHLSSKQLDRDRKFREELQYAAERAERFGELAEMQQAPQIRVVHR
jgi:hypothetical protein